MTRRKTPVGLIEHKGKRRDSFVRRRKGLLTKAKHLSTLCGVPVAVVCADPNGGAPTVKETEQGVLDSYRALPAEKRAEHTHLRYLDCLLVKEKDKLAKRRQAGPEAVALPHWEMARMTLLQLHDLLQSVDMAMAAAAERWRALGLPPGADDAVMVPCGDSGPSIAGGSESDAGYFHPMQQGQAVDQPMIWQGLQAHGGGGMNMAQPAYDSQPQYNIGNGAVHLGGYQQPMPSNDGNYHGQLAPGANFQPHNAIAQPWNGGFQYDGSSSGHYPRQIAPDAYFQPRNAIAQPCNYAVHLGGYQQQMPSNGGNYHRQLAPGANFQTHNAIAQPWNGAFQYDDGSSSHVGTSRSWMQVPSNGNFNNSGGHDLAIWSPAESSNAIAVYPYMHTSGNPRAPEYPGHFTADNSFPDTMAEVINMGAPGNGMNYLGGYETQGSSNDLQYTSASQNSSSVRELFSYGSDD